MPCGAGQWKRSVAAAGCWHALAAALAVEPSGDRPEQTVEFHAEAGAPEGALYIDGRLVGWIEGVRRL